MFIIHQRCSCPSQVFMIHQGCSCPSQVFIIHQGCPCPSKIVPASPVIIVYVYQWLLMLTRYFPWFITIAFAHRILPLVHHNCTCPSDIAPGSSQLHLPIGYCPWFITNCTCPSDIAPGSSQIAPAHQILILIYHRFAYFIKYCSSFITNCVYTHQLLSPVVHKLHPSSHQICDPFSRNES